MELRGDDERKRRGKSQHTHNLSIRPSIWHHLTYCFQFRNDDALERKGLLKESTMQPLKRNSYGRISFE